jgi:hypothetical protein
LYLTGYFIKFNTILLVAAKVIIAPAITPKAINQSIPIILVNWLLIFGGKLGPSGWAWTYVIEEMSHNKQFNNNTNETVSIIHLIIS